ncbi:hypothetical protein [Streptomyces sp. NPDC059909]|uniref:hypothetical protein n=1 Tax=Streptomyces sp. NPDC059909 TaxID=3346998 RepID=UPI00366578BC
MPFDGLKDTHAAQAVVGHEHRQELTELRKELSALATGDDAARARQPPRCCRTWPRAAVLT